MAYEDAAPSFFFPILGKEDLHLITEHQSLFEFSSVVIVVVNHCPLEVLLVLYCLSSNFAASLCI